MTKTTQIKAASPKRRKVVSLDKKRARAGWIFVMPFVIGLILIYLPIVIDSLNYSFHEIEVVKGGGFKLNPVGFGNYQNALFENPNFVKELLKGLKSLAFDIPAIVIFSLFVAVLLNKKMFGRAAFRAIFFIPVILATGLIANVEMQDIMGSAMGGGIDDGTGGGSGVSQIVSVTDLSWLFKNMQIGTELLEYVTDIVNNIYNIINRSGVQMLIFLAGLQSISPAIYESCSIDGATGWETFWKITIPMISPMILVNTIYTVIDSFTSERNTVMRFIDQVYNGSQGQVLSTAMAWIYFLIVIAFIAVIAGLLSMYIFYQKRD